MLRRQVLDRLKSADLPGAAEALARLEQEDPLSRETRGLRLDHLIRVGRLEEAAMLAATLLELFPDSPRIRFLAGQAAYRAREYDAALEQFRESERLHPDGWTRVQIGCTLTQIGRFDEAEAVLTALTSRYVHAWRDLAWLHERKGDAARALEACERYLEHRADDPVARSQRTRLRARITAPAEFIDEVETLRDLGEDVSPELVPEYVDTLIRSGRSKEARQFLAEAGAALDPSIKARVAWIAYRLQAYDLALDYFIDVFPTHGRNVKLSTAMEAAARRVHRVDRVIALYAAHAVEDRRLYGRIKRLSGSLGGG